MLAVDDVSFSIPPGGTLGVVGESGCGKSVTALSVMRLVPEPPGQVVGGEIRFEGKDLLALPEEEMRRIRGHQISMIFQEPMTSLNPVYTVGEQIGEAVRLHQGLDRKQAQGARGGDAAPGGHPRSRAARGRVSAPALRRHAPAGDDRHGAGVQPGAGHRGRAHHRAGRDDPGADPRSAQAAAGRARHGGDAHHPRSGRGGRELRRGGGDVRRAAWWSRPRCARSSAGPRTRTRRACCAPFRPSSRWRVGEGASG